MPLNYTKLEKRLNDCDNKLSALFTKHPENEALQRQVKAVQHYYNLSYAKAKKDKTITKIINSYELYVQQLKMVKNNPLVSGKILKTINNANDARKIAVIFFDLAKAAESLFWVATGISLYASVFVIAIPMLIVQTPLGIALSIVIAGLLIKAVANCIQCMSEFRSYKRHQTEYVHEVNLLSFFKSEVKQDKPPVEKEVIEVEEESELYSTSSTLNLRVGA